MITQEKALRSMTERVSSFCPGSFGITEFGESGSTALFTERCVSYSAYEPVHCGSERNCSNPRC